MARWIAASTFSPVDHLPLHFWQKVVLILIMGDQARPSAWVSPPCSRWHYLGHDDEVSVTSGPDLWSTNYRLQTFLLWGMESVCVCTLSLPFLALQSSFKGDVPRETSLPLPTPVLLGFQCHVSVAQRLSRLPTRCSVASCPDFCSTMDQNVPLLSNNLVISPTGNLHSDSRSHIWQITPGIWKELRKGLRDYYRVNCVPLKNAHVEALSPRISEWDRMRIRGL